jgi:hypothetical protein
MEEPVDCKTMAEFAAMHNLLVSIDIREITPVLRGSNGLVFVYSDVPPMLGVAWCPDELSSEQWTGTIRKMLRLGFSIVRDCASESIGSFPAAASPEQASLALAIAGIVPAPDAIAIAQNAAVIETIMRARMRKSKTITHERAMKALRLMRSGVDLYETDYHADFVPAEFNLTL